MYSELKLERIQETLANLEHRIQERFPGSGLGRISAELQRISLVSGAVVDRLRRPMRLLRVAMGLAIMIILALAVGMTALGRRVPPSVSGLSEGLQGTEALLNTIVFAGLAILFIVSLETRVKRRIALRALHHLRSVVHIIDMHQLTKDPETILYPHMATESSPPRLATRFELARYLDYCSELLSLTSKLAALHVQYLNDPIVLDAVNDIEVLASNLSNKIWQKITILDTAPAPRGSSAGGRTPESPSV